MISSVPFLRAASRFMPSLAARAAYSSGSSSKTATMPGSPCSSPSAMKWVPIMGTHFIAEGLEQGEPGIVAVFEELPDEYAARAAKLGMNLDAALKKGTLEIIYLRPLDLSVDETLYEVVAAVKRTKAKRLVIDSLVGFELALAPGFRTEFRESLSRMGGAVTRLGVTIISTVEVEENLTALGLSNYAISFLSDDIIRMRYVSINGQFRRMLLVVKMRSGKHSIDMREYQVTSKGIVIGERLQGYRGLTTGVPAPWDRGLESIAGSMEELTGEQEE